MARNPTPKVFADEVRQRVYMAATRTVKEAAAQLGISERTLYRRMDDFGIRVKRHAVLDAAA